jgi:predicted nucleic-acid-binding protein
MSAVDTNVLVRWLTNDDAAQCAVVETLFRSVLEKAERLFVPVTVVLEVECVLRSRYRFDRASITAALDALLSVTELELQSESALEVALWLFKQQDAPDFADCLHVGLARQEGKQPLLTFDARAAELADARLLTISHD